MHESEDVTKNYVIDDYVELLPKRCRECAFARFILAVSDKALLDQNRPLSKIVDIELSCSGHRGADEASEFYDPDPMLDRSGCPYREVVYARRRSPSEN